MFSTRVSNPNSGNQSYSLFNDDLKQIFGKQRASVSMQNKFKERLQKLKTKKSRNNITINFSQEGPVSAKHKPNRIILKRNIIKKSCVNTDKIMFTKNKQPILRNSLMCTSLNIPSIRLEVEDLNS